MIPPKLFTRLTGLCFLLLFGFQWVQSQDVNHLKAYETEAYRLEYPADWIFELEPYETFEFAIITEFEDEADNFGDNINLIVESNGGLSIEAIHEASQQDVEAMRGFNIEKQWVEYNGITWSRNTFEVELEGMRFKLLQQCVVKGDMLYLFTITCINSSYAKYEDQMEAILQSFEFKS